MKKSELINNIVTVLTFLLIPFVGWVVLGKIDESLKDGNAHTDSAVATLKQSITENYETQTAHAADISAMKQWNQNLNESVKSLSQTVNDDHVATSVAIQQLTDAVNANRTTTTTTTHIN